MLGNDISTDPSAVFSHQPERFMLELEIFFSSIHSFAALLVVPIHAISVMRIGE